MIFLRGFASYSYNSEIVIRESQRKLRECLGFLKNDYNDSGEIPSTRRNFQEGFPKVVKGLASLQSQFNSTRGGLNIVFQFWQLSSNSAKPPQPAPCGFVLCSEVGNILCNGLNSTMSYLHTRP
jgi:hypothetical protein